MVNEKNYCFLQNLMVQYKRSHRSTIALASRECRHGSQTLAGKGDSLVRKACRHKPLLRLPASDATGGIAYSAQSARQGKVSARALATPHEQRTKNALGGIAEAGAILLEGTAYRSDLRQAETGNGTDEHARNRPRACFFMPFLETIACDTNILRK